MELIDKAAIAAEIERIKEDGGIGLDAYGMGEDNGKLEACDKLLSFIDSIETKDVDLEKEIQAFAKMDLYPIELSDTNLSIVVTKHQIYKCARHFFKLGLKAKENEQNL